MYRYALNYLKKWSVETQRKPLVVRGARQVGKSTLVRMFAEKESLQLAEINFDKNPEFADFLFKKIKMNYINAGQEFEPTTIH